MRIARAALLVVVVGAMVGCGSDKKASAPASGGTTIAAHDFRFEPRALSAKAGERVTVTLKNEGKVEHNFTLSQASADGEAEPGASTNVTFTAPAAGTYEFFCKYHKDMGMTGTLTVS
jgi:plastocyanin